MIETAELSKYQVLRRLAEGIFTTVDLVRDLQTNELRVVKTSDTSKYPCRDVQQIFSEPMFHRQLADCPFVIKLLDSFQVDKFLISVIEYAANGDLLSYAILQKSSLSDLLKRRIFYQTCKAIESMHSKGLIHRDIKPENVLLDVNLQVKLCDFGWCCKAGDLQADPELAGTIAYMSPECLSKMKATFASDLWALGILLFEIYHLHEPFYGDNPQERLRSILESRPVFDPSFPEDARDLFDRCTVIEPERRLSIAELLQHRFFFSLNLEERPSRIAKNFILDSKRNSIESSRKEYSPLLTQRSRSSKGEVADHKCAGRLKILSKEKERFSSTSRKPIQRLAQDIYCKPFTIPNSIVHFKSVYRPLSRSKIQKPFNNILVEEPFMDKSIEEIDCTIKTTFVPRPLQKPVLRSSSAVSKTLSAERQPFLRSFNLLKFDDTRPKNPRTPSSIKPDLDTSLIPDSNERNQFFGRRRRDIKSKETAGLLCNSAIVKTSLQPETRFPVNPKDYFRFGKTESKKQKNLISEILKKIKKSKESRQRILDSKQLVSSNPFLQTKSWIYSDGFESSALGSLRTVEAGVNFNSNKSRQENSIEILMQNLQKSNRKMILECPSPKNQAERKQLGFRKQSIPCQSPKQTAEQLRERLKQAVEMKKTLSSHQQLINSPRPTKKSKKMDPTTFEKSDHFMPFTICYRKSPKLKKSKFAVAGEIEKSYLTGQTISRHITTSKENVN